MTRIVFVDDEPSVLDALRARLRRHRKRFEMEFLPSAEAALESLEARPAQVIVSDARMPGMGGVELLERLRDEHPTTVRILLSGQVDRKASVRALGVAHQFLSKPCEAKTIVGVLERAAWLAEILDDSSHAAIVTPLGGPPTLPKTYRRLQDTIARRDATMADVAAVVGTSPSSAARVLQIVNSTWFGARGSVTDLEEAVSRLGLNTLRGLVLSAGVFDHFASDSLPLDLNELERHATSTAHLAARIFPNEATLSAGLLHDIGLLVMAASKPDLHRQAASQASETGEPLHVVERAVFGVDHARLGAYCTGLWGLPTILVEAIGRHHSAGPAGDPAQDIARALQVADLLCSAKGPESATDEGRLEQLGTPDERARWMEIAAEVEEDPEAA